MTSSSEPFTSRSAQLKQYSGNTSPAAANFCKKFESDEARKDKETFAPLAKANKTTTTANNNNNNKQTGSHLKPPECFGCHKPILERYLLKALEQVWHEDCLKCSCCNCRLGEIGSTLFTKADLILCKRDYLRMFGTTGFCNACNKQIPAFEMVMRARGNVYHLECFKCEACSHRFCVGDRFYLHENKILCEYDYEEQMALSQMQQQRQFFQSLEQQSSKMSSQPCSVESECDKPKSYGVLSFPVGPSHYP